jgi:hypothetical protein
MPGKRLQPTLLIERPTMAIIPFFKATNPPTIEPVHINTGAILFVEATSEHQIGQTLIQVFGQTEQGVRVVESVAKVLDVLPGSVAAHRHYHAGTPTEGESVVHIYTHNIATIVPNTPHDPVFWTITFKDQFALRVKTPLPIGL